MLVVAWCLWPGGLDLVTCPRDLDLAVGTRVPVQKTVGELLFVFLICSIIVLSILAKYGTIKEKESYSAKNVNPKA